MDTNKCAQDVLRCAECRQNIVEMLCIFCSMYMCSECVRDHASDSRPHQFINLKERENDGQNYSKCSKHEHFFCKIFCRNCDVYLCTKCILSNAHHRHKLLTMPEVSVLKSKEELLQKDINELKAKVYPAYKSVAEDIEREIQTVVEEYEKLSSDAMKYGRFWHEIIDRCTERFITKIEHNRKLLLDDLTKDLEEIQKSLSQISHDIENIEQILCSKDASYVYMPHAMKFDKLPPKKYATSFPKFKPCKINEESIYKHFGSLSEVSFEKKERGFVQTLSESYEEPKVVSLFNTGIKNFQSLAYVSDEQIWMSGQVSEVKCFNIQGQVKETLQTKTRVQPADIGVTKKGHLVYCDEWGSVNIVREGKVEEVIKLADWSPRNLCVASNDDLLIMMYSQDFTYTKLVRYSKFKVVQVIQCDSKGQPLFSENVFPKYLCENGNQDVCVADSDAKAVVVVNKQGILRFRYKGLSPSQISFQPFGICVNSKAHIFIADGYNHSIHIIDQNGKFLQQIVCGLDNPHGLCIDKNENLFVAEYKSGNVKKITF